VQQVKAVLLVHISSSSASFQSSVKINVRSEEGKGNELHARGWQGSTIRSVAVVPLPLARRPADVNERRCGNASHCDGRK